MQGRWIPVIVSWVWLALPGPAIAQQAGTVQGIVVDVEGQAVGDATVVISGFGSEDSTEVLTSSDGRFGYPDLSPGLYTITAIKAELGGDVFRIRVRDGQTVAVNFELQPGRRVAAYLSEAGEREALSRLFASAIEASRAGEHALAVERFLSALEVSPTCLECHFNLAVAYTQLDQLGDAELEFQRAIMLNPEYAAAYYGLSGLYTRQGRLEEATDARNSANRIALARLEAGRARAEDAVGRGVTFLEAGNVADAVARFEAAIEQDATFGPAHYWLGVALIESGRGPQSQSAFRSYLQLDPSGEFADDARRRLDEQGR